MNDEMNNMLNEDELTQVNGGVIARGSSNETNSQDKSEAYEEHQCSHCNKKTIFRMYSGCRGVCTVCNNSL